MGMEIHEIWEMVKNILEILDKIYHTIVKEEADENEAN